MQNKDDCISRQAVLDMAYAYGNGLEPEGYCVDVEDIQALPPAQPERMRGRWIIDRGLYKCSCCKQLWVEWWAVSKPIERMNKEMPYCPMCGADMRGE